LRIAVGIGRPESKDSDIVSEHVLSDIPPDELDRILHQAFPAMLEMLKTEVDL
jgi:peptidyl-tRNA hydrolase